MTTGIAKAQHLRPSPGPRPSRHPVRRPRQRPAPLRRKQQNKLTAERDGCSWVLVRLLSRSLRFCEGIDKTPRLTKVADQRCADTGRSCEQHRLRPLKIVSR